MGLNTAVGPINVIIFMFLMFRTLKNLINCDILNIGILTCCNFCKREFDKRSSHYVYTY